MPGVDGRGILVRMTNEAHNIPTSSHADAAVAQPDAAVAQPDAAAAQPAAATPAAAQPTAAAAADERIDYTPSLAKAWGHLRTISRHKLEVGRLCFKLGLYRQGLTHDLSKFGPTEFAVGARYFNGQRSPNDFERRDRGFSTAWLHHKGRNRHHFEYWMDVAGRTDRRIVGKPMPGRYVLEMLCDRIAACKVYQGAAYTQRSALEFFTRNAAYNTLMDEQTRAFLGELLQIVADEGEDAGLARIRREHVRTRAPYGNGIPW